MFFLFSCMKIAKKYRFLHTKTIFTDMESLFSYKIKNFEGKTKRFCQTLKLKDDADGIEKYVEWHSKEKQWKEVRDGIREVGILEMEIYRYENLLFMIVETPDDFDWEASMARLATLPRQEEWERTVAEYQDCNPDDTSAGKWKLMERIFHLYD